MEIYLLREEKQLGPYAPDDLRSWVNDGNVIATELAWAPGMESWVPLNTLLEPEVEPEPVPEPQVQKPILKPRPKASEKQKAFLSYMGASFTARLTDEDANHLVHQVSKDRKLAARLARWEHDRLDLHPDMFKEEIEARRANRPAYFHKLVQTEGGDCFTGVTKAHCQVLVGYLDVNYPRWDANLTDAAWHYFFPAIAEKFPQLVHKEWRPKLKYKEGPKVAAELLEKDESDEGRSSRLSGAKLVSRAIVFLLLLGLAAAGVYGWQHPEKVPAPVKEKLADWKAQAAALIRGDEPPPLKKVPFKEIATAPETASEKSAPKPEATETPKPAAGTADASAKPADMAGGTPKPAGQMADAKPPEPAMAAAPEAKPDAAMAPAEQPKPTEALFNPNATAAATPPAPSPGAPAMPVSDTARTEARLTQPVQIPSKYGIVTIAIGTKLKIVSHEGDWITLNHLGQPVRVPVSSTDFGQ